jgi:Fe2+ transport system protein FeoA
VTDTKITNLGMAPLRLDPGPDDCQVVVHNTTDANEPVIIQVDDIAVALERADVDRIHHYLGHVLGRAR